tara:strand:+ start:647 stop:1291 length:645 start_codon:yes stop_codon:yes gene_type:complete
MAEAGHEYIAYPIVCFCDIPLSRIQEHVGFYGDFGLGMTKEWAESNGLNPILYVSPGNNVSGSFNELNQHANKLSNVSEDSISNQQLAKITMRYLLAHTKPIEGTMVVDGEPVKKVFYQESEWRYVPKDPGIAEYMKKWEYDDSDKLKEENEKTRAYSLLKFLPKDIKYIFVKSDADIPDLINFIQSEMDDYPGADLKVLMSRVTSLESISRDV